MLGEQLRDLREKLGLTLEELGAEAGGYTRGYLSDLETRSGGKAALPAEIEPKIIAALKRLAPERDQEVREAILALLAADTPAEGQPTGG